MVRVRAWGLYCLLALLLSGVASAQLERIPQYTSLPDLYRDQAILQDDAAWMQKAYLDPVATVNQEPDKAAAIFGKSPYDVRDLVLMGPAAIRVLLTPMLVEQSSSDPAFLAVLAIARTKTDDRYLAARAAALLYDTVKARIAQFPKVAEPAREIFLQNLSDQRVEVKYLAINGLALVGNPPGATTVTAALVKELADTNEGFVEAVAAALGALGDKSAVKPLMERFLAIPEDTDTLDDGLTPTLGEPGPPLNEARLAIAIAVGKLTGIDRQIIGGGIYRRDYVLGKYDELTKWWEANKGNYQ
jgi:hypothetical protein